jgi:hypothetical protein
MPLIAIVNVMSLAAQVARLSLAVKQRGWAMLAGAVELPLELALASRLLLACSAAVERVCPPDERTSVAAAYQLALSTDAAAVRVLLENFNTYLDALFDKGEIVDHSPEVFDAVRVTYPVANRLEILAGLNIIIDTTGLASYLARSIAFSRALQRKQLDTAPDDHGPKTVPLDDDFAQAVRVSAARLAEMTINRDIGHATGPLGALLLDHYRGSLDAGDRAILAIFQRAQQRALSGLGRFCLFFGPNSAEARRTAVAAADAGVEALLQHSVGQLDEERFHESRRSLPLGIELAGVDGDDVEKETADVRFNETNGLDNDGDSDDDSLDADMLRENSEERRATGARPARALASTTAKPPSVSAMASAMKCVQVTVPKPQLWEHASSVYDPTMILAMLRAVIPAASAIQLLELAERGAIGFAIICRACLSAHVRRAAGAVLTAFGRAIVNDDSTDFKIMTHALFVLKDSINNAEQRIPLVHAHFFSRVIEIIFRPDSAPMYPILTKVGVRLSGPFYFRPPSLFLSPHLFLTRAVISLPLSPLFPST